LKRKNTSSDAFFPFFTRKIEKSSDFFRFDPRKTVFSGIFFVVNRNSLLRLESEDALL